MSIQLTVHAGLHVWGYQGWHLAATESAHRECVHAPVGIQSGLPMWKLRLLAYSCVSVVGQLWPVVPVCVLICSGIFMLVCKKLLRTPMRTDKYSLTTQVFEQLFQLYEQQIPKKAEKQFRRELWINQKEMDYMCPGEQLVDVTFKMTPSQPTLHIFWSDLTGYAFAAFAFSFLFVSLGLGIFKCALASLHASSRSRFYRIYGL